MKYSDGSVDGTSISSVSMKICKALFTFGTVSGIYQDCKDIVQTPLRKNTLAAVLHIPPLLGRILYQAPQKRHFMTFQALYMFSDKHLHKEL